MSNSHIAEHLEYLIQFYLVNTGKEPSERDKKFFSEVLSLTYTQGYQQAANLAADIIYNEKFKLSPDHFDLFMRIHRSHMKAWGADNQKKYSLPNVKDVIYDKEEDCLKVYYEDTWWHYDRRGTWY